VVNMFCVSPGTNAPLRMVNTDIIVSFIGYLSVPLN
jgi:hypothetical protein